MLTNKSNTNFTMEKNPYHTDKTDDDSDGDGSSLICGFGKRRRRRTEDSSDSIDIGEIVRAAEEEGGRFTASTKGEGDNNTLICGFGFGDDLVSDSSADVGEEDFEDGLKHWVFEGRLPGQGGLDGSGREEEDEADQEKLNGHRQTPNSLLELGTNNILEKHAGVSPKPVVAPGRLESQQSNVTIYSVSTKIDDGGNKRPARRRGSGMSSCSSVGSTIGDDMSMASEDAVVLMLDLMNGEGDAPQDNQQHKHKHRRHTEICGRVYRHVPNVDYISIPTELQIEGEIPHGRPRDNNNAHPFSTTVEVGELMSSRDQGPPRNIVMRDFSGRSGGSLKDEMMHTAGTPTKQHNLDGSMGSGSMLTIPQSLYPVSSKKKSPMQSPSSSYNSNYRPDIKEIQEQSYDSNYSQTSKEESDDMAPGIIESVVIPMKRESSLLTQCSDEEPVNYEDEEQLVSTKLDIPQNSRRSTDLDVIEEGSRDSRDSSTILALSSSFMSKGSRPSRPSSHSGSGSDYAFDDEFADEIDPQIDMMIDAVLSSRKKALSGEHAKSMAKELKREAPIKTLSERMLEEEEEREQAAKKDEGRVAIVSRQSSTEYVKKIIPKTQQIRKLIHEAISANILFKACSDEELDELVDVFDYREAATGSIIIRQGDEGDAFFVMESGIVDVSEEGIYKTTLKGVISFGEIALLYGCPRSATLRARQFCKLWYISRTAFRAITSQFKRMRLEAKIESLKKVNISGKSFSEVLSESEIDTLALATITESYKAGHVIIREGDPGDIFYMIDSGSVDVFVNAAGEKPVATLTNGQFFGEKALLSNDVRGASCIAKTDVKCHILMRNDFNLLLGDLQALMETNYKRRSSGMDVSLGDDEFDKPELDIEIDDLDILKVLGIGAFGRVQLAKLKKPVEGLKNDDGYFALKCISKQSLKESGLEGHMHNEKKIMESLDHPFINRFYCEMEDDKHLYFLLEALTGGELCKRLREEKKFPEPWGKFYSASVLFAFCHMHAIKIAYRDLKPENLVMDSVGYVKVVDFGLAKVVEGGKTWTLCGTPAYLAPEIVLNDGHDWGVDYWALGVFLFEMTSGKEPFRSKNPMEVYKQIVSGHVEIPSYFSANLGDLIRKLLNISKSKRLGRTMGGGGAVMQHRWYSGFDWDAHLEKRLKAPLQPKNQILSQESAGATSNKSQNSGSQREKGSSSSSKAPQRGLSKHKSESSVYRGTKSRISYSLGQGNRHHQKLLEFMGGGDAKQSEQHNDAVRMTMLRVIKQNERWSKASDMSEGNDSTRNTSLGVGAISGSYNMSADSSVDSEYDSMAKEPSGDAGLRMQLMNLSLPSKRVSLWAERGRAFRQFSLLGINPSSFEESDIEDVGSRFLDPFSTKKISLLDEFPTLKSQSVIDSEALAAFCFPNGLSIRLIPKCAAEGARRLGWLGEDADHYQLQGFTDVAGSLSHGIAITIHEELVGRDAQNIRSILALYQKRRRSIAVISRWLIQRIFHRNRRSLTRPARNQSMVVRSRSESRIPNRRNTVAEDRRSGINQSFRGAVDRMMSMKRGGSKRGDMWQNASASDITSSDDRASEPGYESDEDITGIVKRLNSAPLPDHIRRLGRAAYQTMIDAHNQGDICVVEKSYVITGTPLQDQSLFFCGLQNLINMERLMKDKADVMKHSRRRSNEDGEQNDRFVTQNRHAVLSALESKFMLDPCQKRVHHPRSEMAHIQNPQRKFVMNLAVQGFDKISLPLPLPQISAEWGLATLFLRIKDSGVIILLKLLLLERSVLVVGSNTEEVTSCATALLEMLHPYKWASAFMPLLPGEMLDFVSSPVPFIAGTIVESSKRLHDIIHDTGVREAMLNGLSIVNLVTGKLIVTREQGTSDMLRRSFQAIPELTLYQRRLEEHSRSPSSNLRSFQSFFKHGVSRKESLTLCKIRNLIKKHLSQYTMGLNDRSDAWQQYGEFNEALGTFDFCPDKFIQPLKDRMIFQIQFQEMMAHTQLFVGYVEDLKRAHEKRNLLLSGPSAKFIVQWIETRWHLKREAT